MTRKRALVTGGCGFVGRHFVRWLLNHDYAVTVVDDLSTGLAPHAWPRHLRVTDEQRKRFTFHHGDFRDYAKEAIADFDLIVHLAAVVGGRLMIEGDPLQVATDLAIDATFFNWVVKRKPLPRKVLFFSSSAVYPISDQTLSHNHPLTEDLVRYDLDTFGMPDMTYGWSKLTGELLAKFAAQTYDLDVVIYRPFSGYGEDQDFTYPFPSVIRRVANKETPIIVWGSGKQLRDFIYIEDVLDAVFASESQLKPGEALNLGSGVGTSFVQLAEVAGKVIGHKAEVVNDSSKPEGVFARVADCKEMFKYYRPTTSLERGIEIVYEYQRSEGLLSSQRS
ncbi:MAG TPA: NAD-dependent epimerase/dehydratase family protein [Gemmatimonadaceae bacterium]